MSLITPLVRGAVFAGSAGIIALSAINLWPDSKEYSIEPGYANPSHVQMQEPINENDNKEFYMSYDNGEVQITLPIRPGPYGPLVGNIDYHWKSAEVGDKSRLVGSSWNDLDVDTRRTILSNDLGKMLENYGGVQNGE